jgi:hypothetical protein
VTLLRSAELDPDRQKQGLDVIHRNAAAQLALINDLLDMSRVLRGTVRLDMQPIDLAIVVDAAIDALKPTADAKRIVVCVDAERGLTLVSGDQSRLQQIIFNIVSNSLKFTPPDGRIDVRLAIEEEDAVLGISDSGEGIAPDFCRSCSSASRRELARGPRASGDSESDSLVRHPPTARRHGRSSRERGKGCGDARSGCRCSARVPERAGDRRGEAAAAEARIRQLNGARVLVVDDDSDARDRSARSSATRGHDDRGRVGAAEARARSRARA